MPLHARKKEMSAVKYTIMIPVYNEESNVKPLYGQLKSVIEGMGAGVEILFIDDGSTDNTFGALRQLYKEDKRVKVIQFRRNFGKSAALSAGFRHAKGEIIITIDGDLQDDPAEIPRFLEKIDEGYDLVAGWKFHRKDPVTKRVSSKIFNWLAATLTKVKVHDFNCCFKAYTKEVAKDLNIYGELHRYIPALARWKGYRIAEIKVKHRPRKHGRSKYGFERLMRGFFDLITVKFLTTYTSRPLHFFGFVGAIFSFLGFLTGSYIVYLWSLDEKVGDRPLLMLSVLLIVLGIQFVSLGLLGEMVVSTHQEQTEGYNIREILDAERKTAANDVH